MQTNIIKVCVCVMKHAKLFYYKLTTHTVCSQKQKFKTFIRANISTINIQLMLCLILTCLFKLIKKTLTKKEMVFTLLYISTTSKISHFMWTCFKTKHKKNIYAL